MVSDVGVVIVTHNSAHVIGDLLDGLPAALDGLAFETAVVDNGSADGTADLVDGRPAVQVVRSENRGYAAGINLGVRTLPLTKAVLVLNPDVRVGARAVRYLMETLSFPRTGIAAPRILDVEGRTTWSLRRKPTIGRAMGLGFTGFSIFSEYIRNSKVYEGRAVVDWALGAALLISRECFDELDGFDESYFLYSEETDFCLRAGDRGWVTRYDPRSEFVHIGAQSGTNERIHAMQIVNRTRLYRRRHAIASSTVYYCLNILSEASWLTRGHHEARASIRALVSPASRPSELGCARTLIPS